MPHTSFLFFFTTPSLWHTRQLCCIYAVNMAYKSFVLLQRRSFVLHIISVFLQRHHCDTQLCCQNAVTKVHTSFTQLQCRYFVFHVIFVMKTPSLWYKRQTCCQHAITMANTPCVLLQSRNCGCYNTGVSVVVKKQQQGLHVGCLSVPLCCKRQQPIC